jgi:hypothetical protein
LTKEDRNANIDMKILFLLTAHTVHSFHAHALAHVYDTHTIIIHAHAHFHAHVHQHAPTLVQTLLNIHLHAHHHHAQAHIAGHDLYRLDFLLQEEEKRKRKKNSIKLEQNLPNTSTRAQISTPAKDQMDERFQAEFKAI